MRAGGVGRDALAAGALTMLRDIKADLSRVIEVETSTGCAAIFVDPHGATAIGVGSGANLAARAAQVEDALLGPTTMLVLQMEVPAAETASLIHRARARGARIILNLAPASPIEVAALRALDLLTVNEHEAAWLGVHLGCGADAAALRGALGVDVVRTLGEAGADVATASGTQRMPARWIHAENSTQRRRENCFVGVLAAALDRGASLSIALARAGAAAALCCTRAGSQSSLPTAAETDALAIG